MAVMIAIPMSLIATFFLMYVAGFTFNMMSLMGMSLCIGILVDDSIVVLENIHRYLTIGYDAETAAEGMKFKGEVTTRADLPENPKNGDLYIISQENKKAVYDGTK